MSVEQTIPDNGSAKDLSRSSMDRTRCSTATRRMWRKRAIRAPK